MSQQRDRDFENALDAVYPALSRAARVLCWSDADADDVVQETLLAAFRGRASFNGEAALLTWCYTILTRVASRANRRHARGADGPGRGFPPPARSARHAK